MELGDIIKNLRNDIDMSRHELAKSLNLSYVTLSKYETNERFPDKNTLNRIASFFNVSTDYLLGRTDVKKVELDPSVIRIHSKKLDPTVGLSDDA